MMKKMSVLITLLFAFFTCAAPELSPSQKLWGKESYEKYLRKETYEKELNRFITHLGYREASGDWRRINNKGCIGLFQFSPGTLRHMGYGYITPVGFKTDPRIFPPELQEKVLRALIKSNELQLGSYMGFTGKVIKGISISRSGIIAAAHLGGATSVMLFLSSGGSINNSDVLGTTIEDYIREFEGYNI